MKKRKLFLLLLGHALVCLSFMIMVNSLQPQEKVHASGPLPKAEETLYTLYLPIIFTPPLEPPYDMAQFMMGNGRLYEVWHSTTDSQIRFQTQTEGPRFFHTKGNEIYAEWEELWVTDDTIYRGIDTSPGNGQYYILRDDVNKVGSAWSPRYWDVGDIYERNPLVTFYWKSDCSVILSGYQRTWLRFEAYHPSYTFDSGITVSNVVELSWLLSPNAEPTESYFYAISYGLVGWKSSDHVYSHISEIHGPGQRPDNTREEISCLQATLQESPVAPNSIIGPLPPPYRAK